MKKPYRRLIILLVSVVAIYWIANVVVSVFGKKIVTAQIEKNLRRKARLDSISLGFPISINLTRLEIEGFLKADYISISPSILGFLSGKVVLNNLKFIQLVITIKRNQDGSIDMPLPYGGQSKSPPVILTGLKVKSGRLIFTDAKIRPDGHQLILNDININISKVAFPPTSLFARFGVSALLVDSQNVTKGQFLSSGWVDFGPKNMDGKVELKEVDATYLAPYYENIISTKKLLSGRLSFTSNLKAKNNDLIAKCHLELSNVIYQKPPEPQEGKAAQIDLLPSILNIFSGDTGNIVFDFVISTKLDNPRLDLMDLRGAIAQSAVQNIASQPPEKTVEKVKEAIEEFKDIGKGLKEVFKKKD